MAGFLIRVLGRHPGWQVRAHATSVECRCEDCPCNTHGMTSQFWSDNKYGAQAAKMLAENWLYRFKQHERWSQPVVLVS